jgi:hypothetical protein
MLVQLNRNDGSRTFTVTATDLPLNPASLPTRAQRPVVAVLGHRGRVAGLAQHLPSGWAIRNPDGLDDVLPGELVLLVAATVADVTQARRLLPDRTQIVALVDDLAPPDAVAGVLTAGADACVRGGEPAILASHLVACRRRLMAGHWALANQQVRA